MKKNVKKSKLVVNIVISTVDGCMYALPCLYYTVLLNVCMICVNLMPEKRTHRITNLLIMRPLLLTLRMIARQILILKPRVGYSRQWTEAGFSEMM